MNFIMGNENGFYCGKIRMRRMVSLWGYKKNYECIPMGKIRKDVHENCGMIRCNID